MNVTRFIASKLEFKSRAALGSTAISAFVIILSTSILSGFKHEIYKSISAQCAEINLYSEDKTFPNESTIRTLKNDRRIESVQEALIEPAIIRKGNEHIGVILHNTDKIESGIIIPRSLSANLNAEKGDSLLSYFVADKVKIRKYKICEITEDPALLEKNTILAYIPSKDLRRVKNYTTHEVQCLEIRLAPHLRNRKSIDRIAPELGYSTGLQAITSTSRFPAIYDWLEILDANVLLILVLMCIVAAFNMVSGFLILIMRSTSTIGILKTLGMSTNQLMATFMRLASKNTLKGLLIGDMAAIILCLIQSKTHIIKLDPQNYFVSFVPVHIDPGDILLTNLIAWACVMIFVLIPARRISKIDPASSTKGETL